MLGLAKFLFSKAMPYPIKDENAPLLFSQAELCLNLGVEPRRMAYICARIKKSANEGAKNFYKLKPVVDILNQAAADKGGQNSATVVSAKRRTEVARAEKLELANKKEKNGLTPTHEIEAAQSELMSILARGLDGVPMHVKKRYPDIPAKYLSAIEVAIAKLRNDSLDGMNTRASDEVTENAEAFALRQLEEEERAEAEEAKADSDNIPANPPRRDETVPAPDLTKEDELEDLF